MVFDSPFIDDFLLSSASGGVGGGTASVRAGGYTYRRTITLPAVAETLEGIVIPVTIPNKKLVRFRDQEGNILKQDCRDTGVFFVRVNLTTEPQDIIAYYN